MNDDTIKQIARGTAILIIGEMIFVHDGTPHLEIHTPQAPVGFAVSASTTSSAGPAFSASDFIRAL